VHSRRPIPAPGADLAPSSHPSLPPPSSPDANRAQERHFFSHRSTPQSNFEVSDDLWHSGELRQPPRIESPCFQKIEKSRPHPPLLLTPPLASQAPPPTPAAKAVGIFGSPPSPRTQARAPGPEEGAGSMGQRAGSVPRLAPASRATPVGTPSHALGSENVFLRLVRSRNRFIMSIDVLSGRVTRATIYFRIRTQPSTPDFGLRVGRLSFGALS